MEIEVLVVPDCPNQQLAEERLRQALDDADLSATGFTTRVVADQAEAERSGFTGSPTILIDGRDPFAEPGATPSLAGSTAPRTVCPGRPASTSSARPSRRPPAVPSH